MTIFGLVMEAIVTVPAPSVVLPDGAYFSMAIHLVRAVQEKLRIRQGENRGDGGGIEARHVFFTK